MPNEEWGVKRLCPTTGKRFYDLNKTPIVSPYTGEVVDLENSNRKLTTPTAGRASPEKTVKRPSEERETGDDLLETEEESDSDLNDDLLEDEEDDTVSLDDIADVGGKDDEN